MVLLGEGVGQLVHSVLEVAEVVSEVFGVRVSVQHHLQQATGAISW